MLPLPSKHKVCLNFNLSKEVYFNSKSKKWFLIQWNVAWRVQQSFNKHTQMEVSKVLWRPILMFSFFFFCSLKAVHSVTCWKCLSTPCLPYACLGKIVLLVVTCHIQIDFFFCNLIRSLTFKLAWAAPGSYFWSKRVALLRFMCSGLHFLWLFSSVLFKVNTRHLAKPMRFLVSRLRHFWFP